MKKWADVGQEIESKANRVTFAAIGVDTLAA